MHVLLYTMPHFLSELLRKFCLATPQVGLALVNISLVPRPHPKIRERDLVTLRSQHIM